MRAVRRHSGINRNFVCRCKEKVNKAIEWKESLESWAKKLKNEYRKDIHLFETDAMNYYLDEDDDAGSKNN